MDDDAVARLLDESAEAIGRALREDLAAGLADPREPGVRQGQFRIDLVVEAAALSVFERAGLSVLSEEAGFIDRGGELIVVMDPLDGSTNASRGIPWYATSLCVLDDRGPRVSLIVNLATGRRYRARRGQGATCDGRVIEPSAQAELSRAMLVLNGFDPAFTTWLQYRSLGATALDLCSVADGTVDASIDFSGALGPWDYLGAWLVLREAGAVVEDRHGRDLLEIGHHVRRQPLSASNADLLGQIRAALADLPSH